MALFCLVHGSTQNAAGWDLLVPELDRRGHETVRVTLPADQPDASAAVYADFIARAIPSGRRDAIVVAHSASGLFLPVVAARRPLRRIVFLAAILPQMGKSFLDQLGENKDMLNPEWIGKDPKRDERVAVEFLFHDCSPEVAQWALTTLRLMYARRAMEEVCPLQSWPDVRSSFIVCANDKTVRPVWCRWAARERLGVAAIELPGGHCPHVSRPAHLADVLAQLDSRIH